MQFKLILCPTDFSDASERAIRDAVGLSKLMHAKVRLLHVFQRPVDIALEGAPVSMAAATEYLEQARGQLLEELQKRETHWQEEGADVEAVLIEGSPHQVIVDQSKEADLILMATHGRSGFQRFVLGSVTERVVRMAHCPVMCLPMTDKERDD